MRRARFYSAFLVGEEGAASTFQALLEVFGRHGLSCSLYTDRGSHYFITPKVGEKHNPGAKTQIGRAMAQLGIEYIPAVDERHSPSLPTAPTHIHPFDLFVYLSAPRSLLLAVTASTMSCPQKPGAAHFPREHQGLLRHSAAVKRTAKEGEPNGRNDGEGRDGGPPPQRFSAKRKLRAVSRLLRCEPLELVARELNVTAARLSQWRDRALLAAEAG